MMGTSAPRPAAGQRRPIRGEIVESDLTIRHSRRGADLEICSVAGEVNTLTAPVLRRALRETEHRRVPRVLLDLSGVTVLAAAGFLVILTAADQARATHRQFALVGGSPAVTTALAVSGAGGRIPRYRCLAEAQTAWVPAATA